MGSIKIIEVTISNVELSLVQNVELPHPHKRRIGIKNLYHCKMIQIELKVYDHIKVNPPSISPITVLHACVEVFN